jgi:hypothetical protein
VRRRIRRRVPVEGGLVFDYEISSHRAFLAKMVGQTGSAAERVTPSVTPLPNDQRPTQLASAPPATPDSVSRANGTGKIGDYVPFKQSRLTGQTNPLRPPLHVETVLIGRALGQPTGYLRGIGYRVRDDGYVEAEFGDGVRKFDTYEKFKIEVAKPGRDDTA